MADTNKLALVGAGSLGQAFAGLLAASGQPVTILSTARTAARLREAGYVRIYGVAQLDVPVAPAPAPAGSIGIATNPAALPAGAGLLFMTKAQQLREVIAAIRPVWPPPGGQASWVGGVQNGLAKDDILAEGFGRERTVGAVTSLSSQGEADGRVSVRSLGMTYLGEFAGGSSARVEGAVAALNQAGIPATAAEDIQSVLWTKACHAAGIFGITAPTRSSLATLMGRADLARAYLSVIRECAPIAAAYGVAIGDYAGFTLRTYLDQPDAETISLFASRAAGGDQQYASMAQDVLAGRALEVDEVFSDLVTRAERAGLAAPRLTLIRDLLRGIDAGR
jgi:2-dehydropantoate 2-reductase